MTVEIYETIFNYSLFTVYSSRNLSLRAAFHFGMAFKIEKDNSEACRTKSIETLVL